MSVSIIFTDRIIHTLRATQTKGYVMKKLNGKTNATNEVASTKKNGFEKLKVIELCAGLGGTRIGVEQTGLFTVVQSSEIEKNVIKTYIDNFGDTPVGDFSKLPISIWKDCDVIAASLPCQSFSTQGKRKGTKDKRGALLFDFIKIVEAKKPKVIFLENVTGLAKLKKGRYLKTLLKALRKAGYFPYYKILKASNFGLAQARERLFIVAFDRPVDFQFPEAQLRQVSTERILETKVKEKYFWSQKQMDKHIAKKDDYKKKKYGFGFKVVNTSLPCRTLLRSASSKLKNMIPVLVTDSSPKKRGVIELPDSKGILQKYHLRFLTPKECSRLQGFPDTYKFTSTESQTYQQLGNAVPVPVITEIFKEIFLSIMRSEVISDKSSVEPTNPQDNGNVFSLAQVKLKKAKPVKQSQPIKKDVGDVFGKHKKIQSNEQFKDLKKWRGKDKANHYMTPVGLINFLNDICPIELDPASSPEVNEFHKHPRIFTKKQNGLKQPWKVEAGKSVFINPPYDDLLTWSNKVVAESKLNPKQAFFFLVPARATETKWARTLFDGATQVVFLKRRLIHNELISSGVSNFPSALFIFNGDQIQTKLIEFSRIGSVLTTENGVERLLKSINTDKSSPDENKKKLKVA